MGHPLHTVVFIRTLPLFMYMKQAGPERQEPADTAVNRSMKLGSGIHLVASPLGQFDESGLERPNGNRGAKGLFEPQVT